MRRTLKIIPFTPQKARLLCLLFLTLLFNDGCAIFGGGSEINRARNFQVSAPKDWKVSADRGESDQVFEMPSGNLVTLTSSCGHNQSRTLEVETKHLLMGARNITVKKRAPFPMPPYTGLYSSVSASMDGATFQLEICVLKKESCVFDFVVVSPKEISKVETESFVTFIKSIKSGTN